MKPLTTDQFGISDAFILDPNGSKYGLTFIKFISIETNKSLPSIRIDGELKVFMNKNDGKRSFSLAIAVDETNEDFFEKLEAELARLASHSLPNTKPEDFKLIKESKNYRNIYCQIYMYPNEKPKCLYSELIDGKRRVKPLQDLVFEKFKDSFIVRIIHALFGKTRGISVCADEL